MKNVKHVCFFKEPTIKYGFEFYWGVLRQSRRKATSSQTQFFFVFRLLNMIFLVSAMFCFGLVVGVPKRRPDRRRAKRGEPPKMQKKKLSTTLVVCQTTRLSESQTEQPERGNCDRIQGNFFSLKCYCKFLLGVHGDDQVQRAHADFGKTSEEVSSRINHNHHIHTPGQTPQLWI